jgi:hypothetical protein
MKVQENVALIYNFQDWGTYSCCFKKCCRCCASKKYLDDDDEDLKNMQKWFKGYYYDKDYQAVSWDYYLKVVSKSQNSNMYTGSNRVGVSDVETGEDSNKDDVAVKAEQAKKGVVAKDDEPDK